MQNKLSYESIILRNHIATVVLVIVALVLLTICIIFLFKAVDFLNKKFRVCLVIICFVFIVIILGLSISLLSDAYYDIYNKSYVSVEGFFTVNEPFEVITNRSTASDTREIKVYHSDGTTTEFVLRMNIISIPDGSYNGKFIYSERTKILLDWEAIPK